VTPTRIVQRSALAAIACLLAGDALAAVTAYTSKAAFDAATAGLAEVAALDFDDVAAGTTIPSGSALGGVTFEYAIEGGAQLVVIDAFDANSGLNSLGLTGDLTFLAGDAFSIGFAPARAIALFVIGEDTLPGDVELQTSAGVVQNGTVEAILADGSSLYFLGLVESDPQLAFTSATLESFIVEDVGDFVWNVDDLRLAPEPAAGLAALAALGALAAIRRPIRT
jgi:hypothetical protein